MKNFFFILPALILVFFLLNTCRDEESPITPTKPVVKKVKIISFEPEKGIAGTRVIISGEHFSSAKDSNLIFFGGGIPANVDSIFPVDAPIELFCKVPDSAKTERSFYF